MNREQEIIDILNKYQEQFRGINEANIHSAHDIVKLLQPPTDSHEGITEEDRLIKIKEIAKKWGLGYIPEGAKKTNLINAINECINWALSISQPDKLSNVNEGLLTEEKVKEIAEELHDKLFNGDECGNDCPDLKEIITTFNRILALSKPESVSEWISVESNPKLSDEHECNEKQIDDSLNIVLDNKHERGSLLHKEAISKITDKERELQVTILELKGTLNKLAEHNANYFGDSVIREIIEKALEK